MMNGSKQQNPKSLHIINNSFDAAIFHLILEIKNMIVLPPSFKSII
jgi:hypothetical protein